MTQADYIAQQVESLKENNRVLEIILGPGYAFQLIGVVLRVAADPDELLKNDVQTALRIVHIWQQALFPDDTAVGHHFRPKFEAIRGFFAVKGIKGVLP